LRWGVCQDGAKARAQAPRTSAGPNRRNQLVEGADDAHGGEVGAAAGNSTTIVLELTAGMEHSAFGDALLNSSISLPAIRKLIPFETY
jgi:hypothetical protein